MSCPQCFTGHPKSGEPKGQVSVIHGRNTYVAQPEDEAVEIKGTIVIIPDVFGWEFVNNRLVADHYASQGAFKVYLPDFMDGTASPPWLLDVSAALFKTSKGWTDYLLLPNRAEPSMGKIREFLHALRHSEEGRSRVGVAGFCWGGLFALKISHGLATDDHTPLVDAVFIAHPSNITLPTDFEKVKKPTSLAIGDKDFMLPVNKIAQVQEIWQSLGNDVDTEVIVYPGAGHGFAVRGDPWNMKQAEQSVESEAQAVRWFEKHFRALAV